MKISFLILIQRFLYITSMIEKRILNIKYILILHFEVYIPP